MPTHPMITSPPTQTDSATRALRLKMGHALQRELERHFRRKIEADVGKRFIKGFMGELDPSDEFNGIDWGARRSRSEAERCADRMIERQAEEGADGFGQAIADSLVVIGRCPPTVQLSCRCEECDAPWTITMRQGKPLSHDAWECPACIEAAAYVW
jgi:hypothetical protein